ncbi:MULTISPECIES: EVE domain-containing protein [unclassified Staphylococcus]|uniref:EVE domain-containing protein n=1 Tax=unclassified Staphylococcus TaxID=91994 RepID=UPI0021D3377A|nr:MULTISPECIES: EVE domain-containing protein [unclassified Staphylococcus]UXR69173.1 EVE domain-containing protein [Staphylococcus sp. IVB6246]UXR71227.1 EVE domain-containing protein [Staphylococcus sp. IVB6240]UXR73501.1 EVE domain-containing protein [Staphylococcus sp. IVB6238]UXR75820.1 EVE domain-containing protein [Staphylococcus sp. IVB6233]UXR80018.1 EVE domain-containing protein [Staphylococcus sp. IVB6218]
MAAETNYFWLNCGYNRWNHNEPLVGQTTVFESGAQFNPTQGFRAFKQAQVGDKVIFYQVQTDAGLLGWGEITSVTTGAQNKIHVQFKFNETFKPLTTEYLKRSEALEFRMNNMKETLFNKISYDEFELIKGLGTGDVTIPRYFFMAETDTFEPEATYTIYTHTRNGIKRNGYHHYTQLEIGDQIIIYNKYMNQSIVGRAEVSHHIHTRPPEAGRTNSTAIEIRYLEDIHPISLMTLNKHPKLKNLYFLQENAKQAIASLTPTQYHAMMEMSENDGLKGQFEAVKSDYELPKEEDVKPFILLLADDKAEGLKAAASLVEKANATPVMTVGHPDFMEEMLYGRYLPNEAGALYYREGFITELMPKTDRQYLVIDQFERIDPDIFQTFINVLEGYEMTLPRYQKDGSMVKWSREKDSFYRFNPNWHIVGVTYLTPQEVKEKYSTQMLKYTRIIQAKK